jgi:hypothetical protein
MHAIAADVNNNISKTKRQNFYYYCGPYTDKSKKKNHKNDNNNKLHRQLLQRAPRADSVPPDRVADLRRQSPVLRGRGDKQPLLPTTPRPHDPTQKTNKQIKNKQSKQINK